MRPGRARAGAGAHAAAALPAAAQQPQRVHLRIIRRGEALSVSEVLPTFEHFGLRVIAERPYRLDWPTAAGLDPGFRARALRRCSVSRCRASPHELIAAFRAVRAGALEDDGFNRLLIAAELGMRQVTVLRACCRYLLQTGIPFSQSYMERVLAAHATHARDLCLLFEQRLAPHRQRAPRGRRARAAGATRARARSTRSQPGRGPHPARIPGGDPGDPAHQLLSPRCAGSRGPGCRSSSIPARIPGLPQPRPAFEIFVHSPRVEGVHLRKGAIARGGIRWSERPEDFRTEILGLMKAQHVKNTVIVPVGAKGGFVARRLPPRAPRELQQREVIECYRSFIRGLLDLTDNIVAGRISAAAARCGGSTATIRIWWWRPTRAPPPSPTSPTPSRPSTASGSAMRSPRAVRPATTTRRWAITARGALGVHQAPFPRTRHATSSASRLHRGRHRRHVGRRVRQRHAAVAADTAGGGVQSPAYLPRPQSRRRAQLPRTRAPVRAAALGLERLRRAAVSRGGGIFERSAKSVTLSREAQTLLGTAAAARQPGRDHPRHPVHAGRSAVERRHRHLRQGRERAPR